MATSHARVDLAPALTAALRDSTSATRDSRAASNWRRSTSICVNMRSASPSDSDHHGAPVAAPTAPLSPAITASTETDPASPIASSRGVVVTLTI